MSETIGTPTAGVPVAERGKILKFPTPLPEAQASSSMAAVAGLAGIPGISGVSAGGSVTTGSSARASVPSTTSAFQRLTAVRRRRTDRTEAEPKAAKVAATRPSVSQLVSWLLNLRRGGIGYLYWNAAKLPIEVALVRAARLHDDAIVDVVGHRILVVEPLRPRRVDDALAVSADETQEPEALVP